MDGRVHCLGKQVLSASCRAPIKEWRETALSQSGLPPSLLGVAGVCMGQGWGQAVRGKRKQSGWTSGGKIELKITRCLLCARPGSNLPNSSLQSGEDGSPWVHFTDEETDRGSAWATLEVRLNAGLLGTRGTSCFSAGGRP